MQRGPQEQFCLAFVCLHKRIGQSLDSTNTSSLKLAVFLDLGRARFVRGHCGVPPNLQMEAVPYVPLSSYRIGASPEKCLWEREGRGLWVSICPCSSWGRHSGNPLKVSVWGISPRGMHVFFLCILFGGWFLLCSRTLAVLVPAFPSWI